MMKKIVIFDFDGVLAESLAVKASAFGDVFAPYGAIAKERAIEMHYRHGGMPRLKKLRTLCRAILNREPTDFEIQAWSDSLGKSIMQKLLAAPFPAGAEVMLRRLSKNCGLFIASAAPENEVKLWCRKKNISEFFVDIYGAPRAKLEIIQDIIRNYNHRSVLFVGDSQADIDVAEELSLNFMLRAHQTNQIESGKCVDRSFDNFLDPRWLKKESEILECGL